VFLGTRRRDHLLGMHRMGRGQHHRVDLRIGEQGLVIRGEPQAFLLGESLDLGRLRARCSRYKTERLAVLAGFDQGLAPPAESNNGCIDHSLQLLRPRRPAVRLPIIHASHASQRPGS